jgi:Family of unknown function (DUF6281)
MKLGQRVFRSIARPRIGYVAVLLIGLASLAGCQSGGDGACASSIDVDGRYYSEFQDDGKLHKVQVVGTVEFLDCGDTNGGPDLPPSDADIWQIKGIDTEDGVGVIKGDQLVLYVADDAGDPCAVPHTAC